MEIKKRKIGLDIGTKKIGIAQSDICCMIASSVEVYLRKNLKYDCDYISKLAQSKEADMFVVGLPLKMNGEEGDSVSMVKTFCDELKNHTSLPIVFQDERLSTVSAEKILLEADVRRDKRKTVIDKIAATIILQAYLDKNY